MSCLVHISLKSAAKVYTPAPIAFILCHCGITDSMPYVLGNSERKEGNGALWMRCDRVLYEEYRKLLVSTVPADSHTAPDWVVQEILDEGTRIVGLMCQTACAQDPAVNGDKELEKVLNTLQDCKERLESRAAKCERSASCSVLGSSASSVESRTVTVEAEDGSFASSAGDPRRSSSSSCPSLAF